MINKTIFFFRKIRERLLKKVYKRHLTDFDKQNLEKLFTKVYKYKLWGDSNSPTFYSGPGSDFQTADVYIKTIKKFILENNISDVIDLGCGDFRVSSKIITPSINYLGIDIVPKLINYNNKKYSNLQIKFIKSNIVDDDLPISELCLIRQVLQHLSNKEVDIILEKCKKYKYVIVTEHVFIGDEVIPNLDKKAGDDIRFNSGIFLDKPPFNLSTKLLCEINPNHLGLENSMIQTWLVKYS